MQTCAVLNTDWTTAEAYAAIRLHLRQQGRPNPKNDMWIAAICAVNDAPLPRLDAHLRDLPGLALISR